MTYTPKNLDVYSAAFSGALTGLGVSSNKLPTSSSSANYTGMAQTAGDFAQAFDTQWGANIATDMDLAAIKNVSESAWVNRLPTVSSSTAYAGLVGPLVALVQAGAAYNKTQQVTRASSYMVPVDVDAQGRQIRLHVQDWGTGANGKTLVIIPGTGCNADIYRYQTTFFANDGYRVLVIEQRGHGQSERADGAYTLEMFADDTFQVLEQLNIQNATMMGHSFGGGVAGLYAVRHNNAHIKNLVLTGVGGVVLDDSQYATQVATVTANYPFFAAFLTTEAYTGQTVPVDGYTYQQMVNSETDTPLYVILKMLASIHFEVPALFGAITQISCPTHIIQGLNDILAPYATAQLVQSLIPGSTLDPLNNSGHMCMQSEATAFNALLASYM